MWYKPMAQKKKKFTKEQIAKKVGIQSYMMAAWEQQFDINPLTKNGEPIYTRRQLGTFKAIKELLYEKGFSMDAAKKYLHNKSDLEGNDLIAASPFFDTHQKEALEGLLGAPAEQPIASQESSQKNAVNLQAQQEHTKELTTKLLGIKEKLLKLSNTL